MGGSISVERATGENTVKTALLIQSKRRKTDIIKQKVTTGMSHNTSTSNYVDEKKLQVLESSKTDGDGAEVNAKEKTKRWIKRSLSATRRGAKWVADDCRKGHLMWVKVIFLFQSASLVTLYPYLAVHMRSLGFDLEDAALVNTAVPIADIFAPPLAGMIADKIGNFRLFMAVITFLNGASSLLLLAIPVKGAATTSTTSMDCCLLRSDQVQCFILEQDLMRYGNASSDMVTCDFDLPHNVSVLVDGHSDEGCSMIKCQLVDEDYSILSPDWWSAMGGYLSARLLLDVLRASSLMLFEGAVVAIIQDQGGDYGLQKLFGTAGAVAFGPIAGKLVDWASRGKQREDYSLVIGLYFLLRLATSLCILRLSLDFKPPSKKVLRQAASVLRRPRVFLFLMAFGSAGVMWGFVETFLFWYLEDLGASKLLMGASLAVGTAAGVPISLFSKLIIGKLGPSCVAVTALALYSARLMGLSLLTPSYSELTLLLELAKPVCTTLLLIAAMGFVKDVAPVTTVATVEGIFGAVYFGVGRATGSMIGAWLWRALRSRATLQIFSLISIVMAVFYAAASSLLPPTSKLDDKDGCDKKKLKQSVPTYQDVNHVEKAESCSDHVQKYNN